jgi:hypothetical protein
MRFLLLRNKRPSERFAIGIDFAPDLEEGESLVDGFTVKVFEVTSPTAFGTEVTNDMLVAQARDGNKISARIQGGTAGKDYAVAFHAPTDQGGDGYEHDILVRVRAAA